MSGLVLYTSCDRRTRLDLCLEDRSVWLTQIEISELFQTTKQVVSLHAKNIFEDGELSPEATVKESLTVQTEGRHAVHVFPELAELRPEQHRDLTVDYLRSSVDRMMTSSDQPLLVGPGSVNHQGIKVVEADAEDPKAIEDLETDLKRRGGKA